MHARRSLADAEELARHVAKGELFGITDRGCVRKSNQDQFLIADFQRSMLVQHSSFVEQEGTSLFDVPQGRLLIVADGMGGYQGGEVASAVAIDMLAHYAFAVMPWMLMATSSGEREFAAGLQRAFEKCNARVRAVAEERDLDARMGTTLTMAYVAWPDLFVLHVGDSRCYLARAEQLYRLTRDHTVAQTLVDQHAMSEQEAAESQFNNVLVNTIGGASEKVDVEFRRIKLEPGDRLLLCSDGLTAHVSDAEIAQYLQRREAVPVLAREMLDAAKRGGGTDNITVVLARF